MLARDSEPASRTTKRALLLCRGETLGICTAPPRIFGVLSRALCSKRDLREPKFAQVSFGAPPGTRTLDPLIKSLMACKRTKIEIVRELNEKRTAKILQFNRSDPETQLRLARDPSFWRIPHDCDACSWDGKCLECGKVSTEPRRPDLSRRAFASP